MPGEKNLEFIRTGSRPIDLDAIEKHYDKEQETFLEQAFSNAKIMLMTEHGIIDPEDYIWTQETKYDPKRGYFLEVTGTPKKDLP